MRDWFIDAYEQLVEEYLDKHPNATEAEAEAWADERAYERMRENLADMADRLRDL